MAELMAEARVACRTPAEGRDGVTNIPAWKFDAVRKAILSVLGERKIRFSELKDAVGEKIPADELSRLGSLGWHVTTVKLELEVRGEVERVPGQTLQVIRLCEVA
ncbi:DUF6958 family protein [Roseovarius phycicola]|uniref:Uncharacterized protein n=1 Tax=Roseovarius phycicola TaxID=3080976 RepID=A0ABZ2HKQ6_9RHOB